MMASTHTSVRTHFPPQSEFPLRTKQSSTQHCELFGQLAQWQPGTALLARYRTAATRQLQLGYVE